MQAFLVLNNFTQAMIAAGQSGTSVAFSILLGGGGRAPQGEQSPMHKQRFFLAGL